MAAGKQFLKGLMDNPNFQKWFGESVVRDAEGLPLEVYHGTANDFTSFTPSFKADTHPKFNDSKQSIFLTSNPRLAQDYTGMVESDLSDEALKRFGLNRIDAPDGANIKSGYLSLINPYQVDAAGAEYNRRKMIDWIESARGNGNDGLIVKNLDDSMYKGSPDRADVYAIFDPTQFKSRFNAGTFDTTDPNFLKSLGLMTAGAGAAAYAMSPDDAQAASLEQILRAAKTARSAGAVSEKAIVPRYIMENLTPEEAGKVLDFGSGPAAKHAEMLRGKGYDVSAYDFNPSPGASDPKALEKGPYDTIYASNVLNTQQSPEMLAETLSQLKSALSQSGQIFANYPSSPRYMGLGTNDFKPMIERVFSSVEPVSGRDTGKTSTPIWRILPAALGLAGSSVYALSPDDAEASVPSALSRDLVEDAGKDTEREPTAPPREGARSVGNNTPNVAQAVTPTDPSQLASAAALIAALKSKDQPLEDTYQPADLLTAFLTGGGGLAGRSIQAALDPVFSTAMDYAPRVADAINPRNIIIGLMR